MYFSVKESQLKNAKQIRKYFLVTFKTIFESPHFFNFQVCKSSFTLRVEYSGHLLANLFFFSFSVQLMTSRLTLHIFSSFQRTLKFEVSSPFWKTLKKTLDTHIFQAFFHLSTLNFSTFQFLLLLLWFLVLLLSSMLLQCWCYCCWHGCYWVVVGVFVNIVVVVVTVFFADVVTLATVVAVVVLLLFSQSEKPVNRVLVYSINLFDQRNNFSFSRCRWSWSSNYYCSLEWNKQLVFIALLHQWRQIS